MIIYYIFLKGLVFDIKTEYDEMVDSKWYNTKTLFLERINQLPELEDGWQNDFKSSKGKGYGNSYGERKFGAKKFGFDRDNKTRGFNRDNSNNKRKFPENKSSEMNKKIKFND